MAIKSGQNPILANLLGSDIIANDIYCCNTSSYQYIQGPKLDFF